jgi:HK97 gp10 family phage protein
MGIADAYVESFRMNTAALNEMLRGPAGVVARDLARRAVRVESAAKDNASGRPGPNVITGRLRGSITWRLGADAEGLYADIGTNVEYAPYVEFGTSRAPAYPFLGPALEAAHIT